MQEVQPWGIRGPCGWPTPLEVEVGGGGPTVAPLTPLYLLLVEPPPPLLVRSVWGGIRLPPPLCAKCYQGYPHMGGGVCGLRPKFCQGFPPRGEIVRVWGHPQRLPAIGRPTSWRINLVALWVHGVGVCCPKFFQGFPPRGGIVRVILHPWSLPVIKRLTSWVINHAALRMRGVCVRWSKLVQGLSPRGEGVRLGSAP